MIAVVAYAGWLLWDASHNLKAAADDASAIKTRALGDDPSGVRAALDRFGDHAHAAVQATDSPVWSMLTKLPVIGDDADGVRTAARVGDQLAGSGLAALAGVLGDIDAVVPGQAGVDVAKVEALKQPVAQGYAALSQAQQRLDAVDPSGYVQSLKLRFRDLQSQVDEAAHAMSVADKALTVLPQMLGSDQPRNYLLIMQNNAEIRATGGLPGAVALLHVDHGKIQMVREVTGASFGEAPAPVLPISAAEKELFGANMGRYFLDGNQTPDFARSADLWKARWEQTQPEKIDGVLSLDTVTLSYLLKAIGPVEVGGVQLTSDNAVHELLSDVYSRIPDPAAEDIFFGQVAQTIFSKVTTFTGSKQQLLQALGRAADERRLYIHDFDPAVQGKLDGTAVAGGLVDSDDAKEPQVGVYFDDATVSKMSYYLRYDTHVTATSCVNGVQSLSGTLTLTSTAPADAKTSLPAYVTGDGLPKSSAGDQLVGVTIFGPAGGVTSKFARDDVDFPQVTGDIDGRKAIGTWVLLEPGESQDLHWTMTSGPGQTGAAQVNVTPSVEPGSKSTTLRSAC